jgi:hypothetical protein
MNTAARKIAMANGESESCNAVNVFLNKINVVILLEQKIF